MTLKLRHYEHCCSFCLEEVRDNVVSNNVTNSRYVIPRSDVIIF